MDAREVLKMSMGKLMTGRLVRGINPEGVFDWLEYVRVRMNQVYLKKQDKAVCKYAVLRSAKGPKSWRVGITL
jgi:hypothetical protein